MQITTVGDLLAALSDYDESTPVMIAHQPNYPLAEKVAHLVAASELLEVLDRNGDDRDPDALEHELDEAGGEVLWIVAGGPQWDRSPYAPPAAFEER